MQAGDPGRGALRWLAACPVWPNAGVAIPRDNAGCRGQPTTGGVVTIEGIGVRCPEWTIKE